MQKPNYKDEKLTYDGEEICFKSSGKKISMPPFKQTKAEVRDIKNFLKANTGEDFNVQAIVVYPGWFVKPSTNLNNKNKHRIWVCNHSFLEGLINEGQDTLTSNQITVISTKLSEYIRNYDSKE